MRILVTGASGQLGPYVVDELVRRGHDVVAWSGTSSGQVAGVSLSPVDLTDESAIDRAWSETAVEVVIHLAAQAKPADAFRDPEHTRRVNVDATAALADQSVRWGSKLVFTSTDLAFDGENAPYSEDRDACATSVYAQSKFQAERIVLEHADRPVVVRTALMFGPSRFGAPNFFDQQVAALRAGDLPKLFHDEYRTPLALCTAAAGLAEAAEVDATGLYHLGGPERMSRVEFYERLAAYLGVEAKYEAINRLDIDSPEPRAADVSLVSDKFYAAFPATPRPTMEQALEAML